MYNPPSLANDVDHTASGCKADRSSGHFVLVLDWKKVTMGNPFTAGFPMLGQLEEHKWIISSGYLPVTRLSESAFELI